MKPRSIVLLTVAGFASCGSGTPPCDALTSCSLTVHFSEVESTPNHQVFDTTLTISSTAAASTYLHKDPHCDLDFEEWPFERNLIMSRRVCVDHKSFLPAEPYRDWGEDGIRRTYYEYAPVRKTLLQPGDDVIHRLTATVSTNADGLTTVRFADDVFFAFRKEADVLISLPMRQAVLFDSGEGGVAARFNVLTVVKDGQTKTMFTPTDLKGRKL